MGAREPKSYALARRIVCAGVTSSAVTRIKEKVKSGFLTLRRSADLIGTKGLRYPFEVSLTPNFLDCNDVWLKGSQKRYKCFRTRKTFLRKSLDIPCENINALLASKLKRLGPSIGTLLAGFTACEEQHQPNQLVRTCFEASTLHRKMLRLRCPKGRVIQRYY